MHAHTHTHTHTQAVEQLLNPETPSQCEEADTAPTVETSSKRLSAVADLLNPAPCEDTGSSAQAVEDKAVFDKAAC